MTTHQNNRQVPRHPHQQSVTFRKRLAALTTSLCLLTMLQSVEGAVVNVTTASQLVSAVNSGATGDTVNVAAGTYLLTATLSPKANMIIQGAGRDLTILKAAATWTPGATGLPDDAINPNSAVRTAYLLDLGGNDGIHVSNLTLDGSGALHGAVYGNDADNLEIFNLYIKDFIWSGIRTWSMSNSLVSDCVFEDAGGTQGGIAGGGLYLTWVADSDLYDNYFFRSTGSTRNYFGIKGRQSRRCHFFNNTILTNFAIEFPFENDFDTEIDHNYFAGAISIPKSGGGGTVPASGVTFHIHHNYFTPSYSLEWSHNGSEVDHNLFDFSTASDGGNLISSWSDASQGPSLFHNNLVKNPGRGVYWSTNVMNNISFYNNHIIANTTVTPRTEGLFGFNTACNFTTITIKDNIIECIGQSRPLVRNTQSFSAVIQNNRLTNVSDSSNYTNASTGATQGPTSPIIFTCGVGDAYSVNGWTISGSPAFQWSFNETSGSTAASSGTIDLPVALTGSPVWTSGKRAGAIQFNGTNQYGTVSDNRTLDGANQLTISLWVRPGTLNGGAQFLVSKFISNNTSPFLSVFFYTGNKLYIDLDGKGNRFSSSTVFQNNTWYHLAVVYDGTLASAQRVKLYVNGVLDVTATETSATLPNSLSTDSLYVAQGDSTGRNRFNGLLDELGVYKTALTAAQISSLATYGY